MVAKLIKKSATKSFKDLINKRRRQRNRDLKKTPTKNATASAAAAIVANINKSIYACHRNLITIFSRLRKISTPKRSPRKQGYQILRNLSDEPKKECFQRCLFHEDYNYKSSPSFTSPMKRTVFLDLDETLVHSSTNGPPETYDFIIRPVIDGERNLFYVKKRPFVDEFLDSLSRNFNIVVFTAGLKEYASLVLNRLDGKNVISHRLYRDSCKIMEGMFVKDLSLLGRDLESVVIVDDNPNSYKFQPENGIPIVPFTGDHKDRELHRLIEFFDGLDSFQDLRDAVKRFLEKEAKEEGLLEL